VTKLQKKILIFLIVLSCISPIGILLPKYLNSSGAWGEEPLDSLNKSTSNKNKGIEHFSETKKAPLSDYSLNSNDQSELHQSIYYIISGILGTGLTLVITYLISKNIVKNDK